MSYWQTIVDNGPNILLALSNLACVPMIKHIRRAYGLQGSVSVELLKVTACCSFVSHLLQSHKRNQVGFGCPPTWSRVLNFADLFACGLLGLSMARAFTRASASQRNKCKGLMVPTLCVLALNVAAEYTSSTRAFVGLHVLWHATAYYMAGAWISHLEWEER